MRLILCCLVSCLLCSCGYKTPLQLPADDNGQDSSDSSQSSGSISAPKESSYAEPS